PKLSAAGQKRPVGGLELLHAFDDAVRRRRGQKREQMADRWPTELAVDLGQLKDGLQLRREGQAVSQSDVVQGLDAETIARKKQTAFSDVPHGEREHASKAVDHRRALILVEVDERLSIALGVEAMAATYQARTQLLVVVDFPVEDDPDRPVFVPNGLM